MSLTEHQEVTPSCLVCNNSGQVLYPKITDHTEVIKGEWSGLQCPDCRSYWLSPKPRASKLHEFYEGVDYYTHHGSDFNIRMPLLGVFQDYLSSGYLAQKYGYGDAISYPQRILGWLSSVRFNWKAWEDYKVVYLPFRKGGKVLEVGCGNGTVLESLMSLGWDAIGCDIDSKAVEMAKAKGVNAVHSDIESLSFDSATFDAVGSCHVIEHVHDPEAFLNECYRVLKPGGELRIITPNINALGHKLTKDCWKNLHIPWHLFLFSPQGLSEMATRCGFREVEITSSVRDVNNSIKLSLNQLAQRRDSQGMAWTHGRRGALLGKSFQFFLWLQLLFKRNIGDEIILKAIK